MVPFLRNFRQRPDGGHHFFRYARYAVGEIILVVIGILIALQINNWNEARKEDTADQKFLKSLQIELTLDISNLEHKVGEFREFNAVISSASKLLEGVTAPVGGQRDTLDLALYIFQRLTPFMKNISRNDEFIGQGRLEKIDRELNQKYLTYLDEINASATLYMKLGDALKEIEIAQVHSTVEFRQKDGKVEAVLYNFDELRKNLLIKNGLAKSALWRGYYINTADSLIRNARELVAKIEATLVSD